MVFCCVPSCKSQSFKADGSFSFHDFPSNPDLAAKWIKQINNALNLKPMWFPRGKPVICSKHFLQTDFIDDSDTLRPRSVPTIFGCKYFGPSSYINESKAKSHCTEYPLIVKIKTNGGILENNSSFKITDVCSKAHESKLKYDVEPIPDTDHEVADSHDTQSFLHSSPNNVALGNKNSENTLPQTIHVTTDIQDAISVLGRSKENIASHAASKESRSHSALLQSKLININSPTKTCSRKRQKCNSDVIEIGPNTFLKINPDIIKVNKKLTPSGNTVLQFLMDQKAVKNNAQDILPQIIKKLPSVQNQNIDTSTPSVNTEKEKMNANETLKVLGHLVSADDSENAYSNQKSTNKCSSDKNAKENKRMDADTSNHLDNNEITSVLRESCENSPSEGNASKATCFDKAPILMTTKVPLNNILLEKPKYVLQMKQKSRQIASLKTKLATLTKKIEELEDRCIVQERQLSYSFIKKLKSIRKNASKGDPCATYILEQIRCYTGTFKMRWSDSTLTQCAIWCRKAPYAYEYFRKADFFKLPCLGTVKRYMKKHPEIKSQRKPKDVNMDDDESSSDFDFDDSDSAEGKNDGESEEESNNPVECETVQTAISEAADSETVSQTSKLQTTISKSNVSSTENNMANINTEMSQEVHINKSHHQNGVAENSQVVQCADLNNFPITVDGSNLEVQEIILPSGEVVQCYSSNISSGDDGGNQYYIIPNIDQNSIGDHEYSVVQTETLPVILQNIENSHLPMQQQEQLIFITNSSDQVECNETEVTSG